MVYCMACIISECKHLFDQAMKDGHVKLNINSMLLFGVAGSGKTCLKHLLTDQPPPQQRNSTPCIEMPVRVNIRPVSSSKVQSTGRGWVEISQEKLLSLIAHTVSKSSSGESSQSLGSKVTVRLKLMTGNSGPASTSATHRVSSSSEDHQSKPEIDKAINEATQSVVNKVARELKALTLTDKPSVAEVKEGEQFDSTWVYISDCGGQPQFLDVSPLFVRHISVAVVVFRLTDDFSDFPLDEYFKDGQLVGLAHASHTTLEESLRSLIRSVESHYSQGKQPNLIFVGTFLDQVKSMTTLDEKNEAVRNMLSANMKERVIYNKSLKQPIFAVNTLSREEDAQTIADRVRGAIEACHPLEIKVPTWWFFLDFNLQSLSCTLERGVLRKQECFQLAVRFGFGLNDLEAALVFFNEMCIAHYYPAILPDTVFVNAQIPLDKISELTEYAIALRNAEVEGFVDGKWKKFLDEGVITLEFLELKRFNKHYLEGIFSPKDMLMIMKELLVVAPIPLVGESDGPISQCKYFMPSLLLSFPAAQLETYRISSDDISPIALSFPGGCIRMGVFCCLAVFLVKRHHWEVLLPSGEPILIAKNCIKFRFPKYPCSITLIDSFSYIEVYVCAPPDFGKKLCPMIQGQLLDGIKSACNVLHYNNDTPQISIFCPCKKFRERVHLAEINKETGCWICSHQAGVGGELTPHSRVWLHKSAEVSGEHECIGALCLVFSDHFSSYTVIT